MSSTAVQFYGIDDVVQAYTNRGVPAFAIWCGKILNFRYDGYEDWDPGEDENSSGAVGPTLQEGEQVLRTYLEGLWPLTTATYTLRVYDELKPGQKIRPSTEYDTAFQFKICPPPVSHYTGMAGVYPQPNNPVLKELQGLREEMNALKEMREPDDEDDEEPETIQEAVIGLLQEPERLSAVVEPLRELVSLGRTLLGMEPLAQGPPWSPGSAQMGNVVRKSIGQVTEAAQQPDPVLVQRLGAAINVLEHYDENLVDHLEKLSKIAVSDPVKFKGLLSMLDLL